MIPSTTRSNPLKIPTSYMVGPVLVQHVNTLIRKQKLNAITFKQLLRDPYYRQCFSY